MESYQIRDDFIRYGIEKKVQKGQNLFDPAKSGYEEGVCYLDHGIAALNRINREGEEQIYLYFGEKRVIGFANALVKYFPIHWDQYITPTPFWITAKTSCVYYYMREIVFDSLMEESPPFVRGILGAATLNYLEIVNKVQGIMDGDKTAQFCQWLLTCRVEHEGQTVIPKAFSFVEVAKYLGMHPVTVSRIAGRLKAQGILLRKDGYLVIKDEKKIREILNKGF